MAKGVGRTGEAFGRSHMFRQAQVGIDSQGLAQEADAVRQARSQHQKDVFGALELLAGRVDVLAGALETIGRLVDAQEQGDLRAQIRNVLELARDAAPSAEPDFDAADSPL